MKTPFLLACLLLPSLSGCTRDSWRQAFSARVLTVSYDNLGTEAMVSPALGPRGTDPQIVVRQGATNPQSTPRCLNAHEGLLMLRRNSRHLPRTAQNEPLRRRMKSAYDRLYHYYNQRRDAFLAVPAFGGRGSMTMMRSTMMPPVPPSL
jgi:hypothetical protein